MVRRPLNLVVRWQPLILRVLDRSALLCEQARPEVVLMDIMMSGMAGLEVTKAIRERYPSVQVLVLTSF